MFKPVGVECCQPDKVIEICQLSRSEGEEKKIDCLEKFTWRTNNKYRYMREKDYGFKIVIIYLYIKSAEYVSGMSLWVIECDIINTS